MTTVAELLAGDRVCLPYLCGIYVAQTRHPLWPHLRLVVWYLTDGTWSHDALDVRQDVGEIEPATEDERMNFLRQILLSPGIPEMLDG